DLVLNPLGVPSRMNVGQILEIHLGWGAYELGKQLQAMLDEQKAAHDMRDFLKGIYKGDEEIEHLIGKMSDDDVRSLATKTKQGVFMTSPVFDGAAEADIKGALDLAGLPNSGQAILFDGRTGDAFDQNVTVGIMYKIG